MEYLTVAVAKGRLAKQAVELFTKAGAAQNVIDDKSRKLIFTDETNGLKFFLSKADDVPVYVEYGAADIGICGKDTLLEQNRNLYELLDLKLGGCRMVAASSAENGELLKSGNNFRVATKYPRITAQYFKERKQTAEIVKLSGSVELAPIVGLTDFIIDLVDTGATLKENGLAELDIIMQITARLSVNRASMKINHKRITALIEQLKTVI